MTLAQEPMKNEAGAKPGIPASNGTGRHDGPPVADFKPLRLLDVEIGDPLPAIEPCEAEPGHAYERALVLVRLHTRPLGLIHLQLEQGSLSAEQYARAIWQSLSEEIRAHLREDSVPVPDRAATLPAVTLKLSVPVPLVLRMLF